MNVGIDIEQFVTDPYGSGIQRVLWQLARNWPDDIPATFIVPRGDRFLLLTPQMADGLLALPFAARPADTDIRDLVSEYLIGLPAPTVGFGDLLAIHDRWLLPEVTYLPSVLQRLNTFARCMPTSMIGYDALPMTQPANYRFAPGTSAWVSEYFRLLACVDTVICISDYAAQEVMTRLRRDRHLSTVIAHPGGDHIQARPAIARGVGMPIRFLRVGTMEARKQPLEIVAGFAQAIAEGANAELVFVGKPSASDAGINDGIEEAIAQGLPIEWIRHADDAVVYDQLHRADIFLSVGIEGYGIPVLEALQLHTPVVFEGIQPAGELMRGHGAVSVDEISSDGLSAVFTQLADPLAVAELAATIDSADIPTWQNFAAQVAAAAAARP